MAHSEGMTQIVEAEVVGHEVHNGKPTTKLNIPAWRGKFPLTLYNMEPEAQGVLPMGETVAVELVADKLKDGKEGRKPWEYFWSFVRRADLSEVQAQPTGGQPQPAAPAQGRAAPAAGRIDQETAIRRAVALKAAVDFTRQGGDGIVDQLLGIAEQLDDWLGRPVAAAAPASQPAAKTSSAAPAPAQRPAAAAKSEGPPFANNGEFMAYSTKAWNIRASEIVQTLGVKNATEIEDPNAAYEQLVTAWGDPGQEEEVPW